MNKQQNQKFKFDPIDTALADIKAGKCVVVVDDEHRENEGDVICAAQFATPNMINFMAVKARGLICLALTGDRLDQLEVPLMVTNNTDSNQTAFTVSIDASPELGVSTGISAEDRARTIQAVINSNTKPEDLRRPGHVFPIRAKEGGVLKRAGHTEASIDLARLSGLYPAGVICEIQNPDGSMARLPQLVEYAQTHNLKLISIADIISYRIKHDRFVFREAVAKLPSQFGNFQIYAYRDTQNNLEHIAIVKGNPAEFSQRDIMVRVHSECLTGDAFGSLRCDCRMQLQAAMKMIEHAGAGVVVYLRQEGRGIGLVNKLKAYSLQDIGLDTVEANERLGFPADLRNYGVGAQILHDLGVNKMRLITNNPRKIAGLHGYGIEIVDRVPLLIETTDYNSAYLATKAQKLGHILLRSYLVTIAINWNNQKIEEETFDNSDHINMKSLAQQRYQYLEKLRSLIKEYDFLLQEETRPVATAVFAQAPLIVNFGLEQATLTTSKWYQESNNPYLVAIAKVLTEIAQWQNMLKLEFIIASGLDPMIALQIKLERQTLEITELSTAMEHLETQKIYSLKI
ncbi:GTP cyclohydrolase II / 3,4-dihydroxy-2-butanone 4-phosphate synthase [Trichodesmium erythraeum IMS101]|uniref:Riboflavin biosynthesis protein RibBA n=1 Tax=Trichodesmium erythraeum (strain IMS101) TaxID=203124 RepID=Q10WC5_TRIEI|nr:bifunctional 3,4-dihydroxy-2-butanone-4-phosphate synthase RibB/GTP cyclohydrolase II RibA [Trichodesmium erythraeum GBRTRLIN201]MDT9342398.1 bifunctional 3,4-dihydroxy-2-butanone-4-phosphate synthase/GTP cyclohydrolase II [Trichodesmium erythraeum 21-75]